MCSFSACYAPLLSNYKQGHGLSVSAKSLYRPLVVGCSAGWVSSADQKLLSGCKAFRATCYQKKRHCALKCEQTLISPIETDACPHIHKHTLILRNLNISVIVLSTAGLFVLLICLIQPQLSSAVLYSEAALPTGLFTGSASRPVFCHSGLLL